MQMIMRNFIYAVLAVATFAFASCGEQKIELADPPITFTEYQSSYDYIHNLPLDGCFEVVSVGAVINNREGYDLDAELAFTVNVKMVKALSQKPKKIDSYEQKVEIQYLDKDNNVLGTTGSAKENILELSVGQTGTVIGSVVTKKKDAKELLKKIKYVRVVNLCAAYEDENEKKQLEEEQEAEAQESNVETDEESVGTSSGENWDAVLDSYEKYVNKYVSLMKKANAGDMSAMSEYPSMLQEAQEFSEKLSNAQGELSSAQWARYMRITAKMSKI